MGEETTGAERLAALVADIPIAMVTTTDEAGHYVSRPLAHQEVEDDADLWFFARRDSSVVAHVTARPHVGVTLSSSDAWVSIDGEASLVEDLAKARELWNPVVEAWLPEGPEDPSVVLLRVEGHTGEYWDSPGGKVATVLSFVKSKVTGEPFQGTRSEVVDL